MLWYLEPLEQLDHVELETLYLQVGQLDRYEGENKVNNNQKNCNLF